MKKLHILIIVSLALVSNPYAFSQTIAFDYDNSGNRIERTILLQKGSKGGDDQTIPKKEEMIVDNAFTEGSVKIFPNPTAGNLRVEVPNEWAEEKQVMFAVFNVNGNKIIEKPASSSVDLDLSLFPNGIYILHIKRGEITSRWKIIKQ